MRENVINKVIEINNDKLRDEIKGFELSTMFMVELNGADIQSWEEYISEVQNQFKFPSDCHDSINRYLDWIRDLDWIDADGYVLLIKNYSNFMKDVPEVKNQIISQFTDTILPFWQEEVKHVMVDGQPKRFMVYLVD